MLIATTYEQYKNLPQNRGKDTKLLYKEWLFEESKLQMIYDCYTMPFHMQFNNYNLGVYGQCGAATGASTPTTPLPSTRITYYTPNGANGITLGYYTPDLDNNQAYYIYV